MEKERIDKLPDLPGVYIFRDKEGKIIYIGKANSIKKRVKDHFALTPRSPKEEDIVREVDQINYIVTPSEPEALLLESYLIKEERPKYNINFKDDKTYPSVKITLKDEYPKVFITRRRFDDGSLYLGPYPNVKKLKQSLRALRSIFPFVSCKSFSKTACLYYHLKLCPGPCIQEVDKEEYRKNILSLIKALLGDMDEVIRDLTREMDRCVAEDNFERAALIRDKIKALGKVSSLFGEDRSINVLENIKEKLNLPHLPRVIDAVDISNIGGKIAVGSFVRFRDLEPDKNFYRRFKLKREGFVDDYEMMAEVVLRRFKDILELNEGIPDLLMVDGGKGHLNKIDKVLKEELGMDIPIVAYAKGKDVVHSKYRMQEVSFPDGSSEKNLLERIRDEAHRFAIGYHKLLRKRKAKESILDEIPGIGEEKKKLILSQVAKLKDLEEMSLADLKRIKGIGDKLAERIYVYLRQKKDKAIS